MFVKLARNCDEELCASSRLTRRYFVARRNQVCVLSCESGVHITAMRARSHLRANGQLESGSENQRLRGPPFFLVGLVALGWWLVNGLARRIWLDLAA